MKKVHSAPILLVAIVCLAACCRRLDKSTVYTLYKSGAIEKSIRLHVATFDANDGANTEANNKRNCEIIAKLRNEFNQAEAIETTFWCEKGYYLE